MTVGLFLAQDGFAIDCAHRHSVLLCRDFSARSLLQLEDFPRFRAVLRDW